MKRFILYIMILMMVFSLSACRGGQKSPAGNDVPVNQPSGEKEPDQETQNQTGDQTAYYITGGLLLGSYDESGWHSLCDTSGDYRSGAGDASDFYAKELLAVPVYHVYKDQTLLGDARSIKIGLWEGGYDQVYAQNQKGTYEVVLRSNSGM